MCRLWVSDAFSLRHALGIHDETGMVLIGLFGFGVMYIYVHLSITRGNTPPS